MKKQNAIITVTLLGFAFAACNHKTKAAGTGESVPPAQVEQQMRATYGFAAQLPASTASFAGFYQLGKLWNDFALTKTWKSIRANPLVGGFLDDPSFQQSIQDPDAVKLEAILEDAFGSEAFISFSEGSEAKIRAWMKLNQDLRIANIKSGLASAKGNADGAPRNIYASIMPDLKDLDIPPMIIGFKVATQKAALDSELAELEKDLPPFVDAGSFALDGNHPFKSLTVTASKALPPEVQDNLKQMIQMNMDDPAKADETYQSVLSRKLEIAYGYVGDYFIISIGPDHSHLKLAANYGESLIAKPEVQQATNFTGKPVISFSWSSAEMAASFQQEFRLMEIYEKMKQDFEGMITPPDTQKLETDLKRLDTEGKGVFVRQFTSMIGVMYRDHGLRGELFGGVKRSVPAPAMKFAGVPTDSTFLWLDEISNQTLNDSMRTWLEDFASTAYDTFQRVGLANLSPNDRASAAAMQGLAVPMITDFYHTTRDELAKSLGSENAFSMDLGGDIPAIPMMVPPPIQTGGKMMRLAYLSDVKDRALLNKSWDDYFKLANEILPMTPLAAQLPPTGLPQPVNEVVDGVSLSYFQLPMPTGDLLPNVAVTDSTFVMGTSRSYSLELSKAAAKTVAPSKPLTLDFRVNFKPAFDFSAVWLKLAAENPDLFFNGEDEKADEFKKSEPNIAALLESLRSFEGMSLQGYEENGVPRISSELRWNEK